MHSALSESGIWFAKGGRYTIMIYKNSDIMKHFNNFIKDIEKLFDLL